MRRLALLVLLLAAPLGAQVRFVNRPPDCDLTKRLWDNYLADNGGHVYAPRYQLHAIRASISVAAGEATHQLTGWPRWATYAGTGVLLAFVPHIRQVVMEPAGQRTINTRDWLFDATLSLAPAIMAAGWHWDRKAAATSIAGSAYLATFCYGSP